MKKILNSHKYPRNEEYFFMDGTRYLFENVTHSLLSTWQHLDMSDGRHIIINPANVKFVRLSW